jgi:heat shock protein HslJ
MRSATGTRAVLGALACALSATLALSGCSTGAPTAGAPDPGLRGAWVLTDGHDGYGTMKLLGQDITLTVTGSAVSTGRGSCSDYTATIYGSERSLWVTTAAPHSFSCETAEQTVLQLQYLADLAAVQHSAVTPAGLELTGPQVDLRYTRATPLSLTSLVDRTWQLSSGGSLSLTGRDLLAPESGGYIRFETTTSLSGVTKCVYFTANYRQVADELVASHVLAIENIGCDRSSDQAARDFTRVFDGGFTFALGTDSLALVSSRAGLTLGFNELGTP